MVVHILNGHRFSLNRISIDQNHPTTTDSQSEGSFPAECVEQGSGSVLKGSILGEVTKNDYP